MKRFTGKNADGAVSVTEADLPDALRHLAAFEDALEELAMSQTEIPSELERLKAAGKEKTVRYKELFGQKLMNNHTLMLFERHGIKID